MKIHEKVILKEKFLIENFGLGIFFGLRNMKNRKKMSSKMLLKDFEGRGE